MNRFSNISILLVDDNKADGTIIRLAIRSILPDSRITYFEHGADVIAHLSQITDSDENPDLMFLDLNMPGVDGIQVLKLLRVHQLKKFPVFMLSGSAILGEERLSLKCGADAFYEKPRDFDDFVALFGQILPDFVKKQHHPLSV